MKFEDVLEFVDGMFGNYYFLVYVDLEEFLDLLSEFGFEVMLY